MRARQIQTEVKLTRKWSQTPLYSHFNASAYWKTPLRSWWIFCWDLSPPASPFPQVHNSTFFLLCSKGLPFLTSQWGAQPRLTPAAVILFLLPKPFLCFPVPRFNTHTLKNQNCAWRNYSVQGNIWQTAIAWRWCFKGLFLIFGHKLFRLVKMNNL